MTASLQPVLRASNVSKSFGDFTAVGGVSLEVHPGEVVAIIGPNGAGKSTFFDLLTGRKIPDGGEVQLFGEPVTHMPPWQRVKRGLGRSFQVSSVFRSSTVLENVQIGLMLAQGHSWNMFKRATTLLKSEAESVLDNVCLTAKRHVCAGDVSFGDQRTL